MWKEALYVAMINLFPPLSLHVRRNTRGVAGINAARLINAEVGKGAIPRKDHVWGMISQFCREVEEQGLVGVWDLKPFVTVHFYFILFLLI